jgi:hypothetical protein
MQQSTGLPDQSMDTWKQSQCNAIHLSAADRVAAWRTLTADVRVTVNAVRALSRIVVTAEVIAGRRDALTWCTAKKTQR